MVIKSISLFLSVVMVIIPFILNAQETISEEKAKAISQAEVDAENDVKMVWWPGASCLFKVFGVGAAYLMALSPNETRILGKSPEYVRAYTKAYKENAKSSQWIGVCCTVLTVAGALIAVYLIMDWIIERSKKRLENPFKGCPLGGN